MDPNLIIGAVVALVAIVAFVLLGRRSPALPDEATDTREPDAEDKVTAEADDDVHVDTPSDRDEPKQVQRDAEPEEPDEPEEAEPAPPSEPPDPEELAELRRGLKSTRGGFVSRLAKLFGRKKELDPALLDEIEEVLISADLGVHTCDKMLTTLRAQMKGELSSDGAWEVLREEARAILGDSPGGITFTNSPTVVLVVGVNGVGKTTTIGKIASRLSENDKKVILAAGDTFRAAAVQQLQVWGRRVGCEVVRGKDRADPASVIFDAVKQGVEMGADAVIVDTAGRLHTKQPLMEELKKVYRSAEKALGRAPDEVILVLDSTTGQNAIQQTEMFKSAVPITGIVLTKLDGTAKGGVILGIVDRHGVPVRYIGIGERMEDLREFDAKSFVAALFADPDDSSLAA